jgi:hypothetical protein
VNQGIPYRKEGPTGKRAASKDDVRDEFAPSLGKTKKKDQANEP